MPQTLRWTKCPKWSGSSYEGPTKYEWEDGIGKHKFPNGVVYEGSLEKGEFHGEGTLHYPNGGRYVAKWDRGKLIDGKYFFYDNLEYNANQDKDPWDYCTNKDRQFYTEILKGLRPDGKTLIVNNIDGPQRIPEGTYDVGDGYYDPVKRVICEYDSSFKREILPGEELWILEKCRYEPQHP